MWRTADGGANWQAERDGLPQQSCFFTVLRQGMAGDGLDPAGVYFGTNTGSVFASRDEGRTWTEVARHLPTVLAVEALTIMAEHEIGSVASAVIQSSSIPVLLIPPALPLFST